MSTVLDFSGRAPTNYPPGCVGAVRYIAPRKAGGVRRSKCITEAELDAHKHAGRQVGFVYEDTANNSLGGAAQGDRDGRLAIAEMRVLGVPAGVACYAAVDRDITPAQMPTVAAYLRAFHQHTTAAGYRRGVYGEYDVVVTMLRDGRVDLGWQTVAWSGRRKAQGVHGVVLYQRAQQIVLDGTTCDVNDVWADDWGQWDFSRSAAARTTAPPAPIVTSFPEDAMKRIDLQLDIDAEGHGWSDVDVPYREVVSVLCNTANPPQNGYKPIPDVAVLDFAGKARVVIEEAVPKGRIGVTVWSV